MNNNRGQLLLIIIIILGTTLLGLLLISANFGKLTLEIPSENIHRIYSNIKKEFGVSLNTTANYLNDTGLFESIAINQSFNFTTKYFQYLLLNHGIGFVAQIESMENINSRWNVTVNFTLLSNDILIREFVIYKVVF